MLTVECKINGYPITTTLIRNVTKEQNWDKAIHTYEVKHSSNNGKLIEFLIEHIRNQGSEKLVEIVMKEIYGRL